jgi:spore coat polysaccharide biosynthesis protein SpsF
MLTAIILVRLDSKRLPNKAFLKLGKVGLLERVVKRLASDKFFQPIIATTRRKVDDPLEDLAKKYGIKIFRGSLKNVSKRIIDCIKTFNVDFFARINGDSPFIQLHLLKRGYRLLKKGNYDFVTNISPRSFPYGMSVEIFQAGSFIKSMLKNKDPYYCEHVTPYFYDNKKKFKYKNILFKVGQKYTDVRLVVDTREDLDLLRKMIDSDENIFDQSIKNIVSVYRKIKSNN